MGIPAAPVYMVFSRLPVTVIYHRYIYCMLTVFVFFVNIRFLPQSQREDKGRQSVVTRDVYILVMVIEYRLNNIEPEADAVLVHTARAVGLVESVEYERQFFLVYLLAGVFYRYERLIPCFQRSSLRTEPCVENFMALSVRLYMT